MEHLSYTSITDEQRKRISTMLESLASKPEAVSYTRYFAGLDLQIEIRVAPEDCRFFTPEVCGALSTIIGAIIGVLSPVVYLEGNPHPKAAEVLQYAARRL